MDGDKHLARVPHARTTERERLGTYGLGAVNAVRKSGGRSGRGWRKRADMVQVCDNAQKSACERLPFGLDPVRKNVKTTAVGDVLPWPLVPCASAGKNLGLESWKRTGLVSWARTPAGLTIVLARQKGRATLKQVRCVQAWPRLLERHNREGWKTARDLGQGAQRQTSEVATRCGLGRQNLSLSLGPLRVNLRGSQPDKPDPASRRELLHGTAQRWRNDENNPTK